MPYEYEQYIPAVDGYHITAAMDIFIQAALEEQIKTAYEESGGQSRACGVVTDPMTGEILAMAVYPTFDLNDPWDLNETDSATLLQSGLASDSVEYSQKKAELLLKTWSNKAMIEAYIPGSTFKIITASMALEENEVEVGEHFNCPGYYMVGSTKIRCHKTTGHGGLTFAGGIQQSCNPVLMNVGLRLGTDRFYEYFKAFGYLDSTRVDLPGEGISVFHREDNFQTLDLATSSFGQNFTVTPLQHMSALGAIANGGDLITPRAVIKITDPQGNVIERLTTEVKRQVISTETCRTVSQILAEGVAGDGGARNAYVAGYRVAAKTGTSQKIGYADAGADDYICSCIAYAPAEAPRVLALIMVDEPTRGLLYGSTVAAPYVAGLLETILPYMGVEAVYTDAELETLTVTVPNMIGYNAQQAEARALDLEIGVKIVGEGERVVRQSPAAGEKMERDSGSLVVYMGDGVEESTVQVPNVMGMSAAAANRVLINAGLNIRITGTKQHLTGSTAQVVRQSPAAGETVAEGTVVTLTFTTANETE